MSNKTFLDLPEATPANSDVFPFQQAAGGSGTTKMVTLSGFLAVVDTVSLSPKTVDHSVLSGENSTVYTNTGAVDEVVFTLPIGANGLTYTFYVTTAQNLKLIGTSSDQIRIGSTLSGAVTGYVEASSIGSSLTLIWTGSFWGSTSYQGTWTIV